MKKFYSLVLMATALLIGTNMQAATLTASSDAELRAKWAQAANKDVIQLTNDFTLSETLVLGTASMDDVADTITLDLNGRTLSFTKAAKNMFIISHGKLIVKTSLAGGKIIASNKNSSNAQEVFLVLGSDKEIDAKTATPFSHLIIDAGVYVEAQSQNAISVDGINGNWAPTSTAVVHGNISSSSVATKPYTTKEAGVAKALANGARIDVLGRVNGAKYALKVNGTVKKPANTAHSPYILVKGTLETPVYSSSLSGSSDEKAKFAIAAYSSGYARWRIEGTCEGATAVYAKGGELDIEDATIKSNYEGDYKAPSAEQKGSGANSAGSAIVIESKNGYPGDISVTISGDTKVSAENGYAIEEVVTTKETSEVQALVIEGGVFEGGKIGGTDEAPVYGSIIVSEKTAGSEDAYIEVAGGQVTNGSATLGEQSLADYLSTSGKTHITYVENEEGQSVMVISGGQAPTGNAAVAGSTGAVNWKHLDDATTAMAETLTDGLTLDELEINQTYAQTLTIGDADHKVTVKIGRLVLGANAQVVVNPGSKLIVNGKQGFVATSPNNFLLKTEEGNPAIFLFHPNVTSNRNPSAKVEFVSKSCYRYPDAKNINQRFGIPMKKDGLKRISVTGDHETRFFAFDYTSGKWVGIGYINPSAGYESDLLDYTKMNDPFEYYQLLDFVATSPTSGTKYTMEGNLLGNSEPTMEILENSWKGFANSYMGQISLAELLKLIPSSVDKAIYTYDVTAKNATYEPVTNLNSAKMMLNPMQPFLIRNRNAAANVELDYEHAVYNPTLGIANPSPASAPSRALVNMTMATMLISGEDCKDKVIIAANEDFTSAFDNGYDASKFMNDGINMYVSADEKMAIFATDNLNNTYVGLQTVNGGNYTIEFVDVQGAELTLVDHETGAQVAMVEGATYEFTAAANSTNDYRFEIVEPAKLPTAIENAEAVKSPKGVYTITGQYVGEMNVWNTLPAGIYVVNGEKLVK